MKFRKNMKLGVSIIFLLLIFTTSISLIDFSTKNNKFDENSLSISPADDSYEENDFLTFSYDLSSINGSWLSSINGTGIQSDDDYYWIQILFGYQHVKVNLTFNHTLGNIDMILYDDFGTPLYVSNSPTDDEFIDLIVPYEGIYFILVFGNNSGNSYNLKWESNLNDDWMEDNDDFGNAWDVGPSYHPDLRILVEDEDWFKIYLNPGDTIEVNIYFSHLEGDLELELYDPFYSYRTGSYGITDYENVMLTSDISGYWRIRVYHAYNNTNVYYDLNIWVNTDDWAEENDDFYQARWVGPNYYSDLKIVGFDEDWFQLYLYTGDVVDVGIYFSHLDGDLDLELYDPFDNIIPQIGSYSIDNDEYISFTATMEGDWRIRVYRVNGVADVFYSLGIWLNKGTIGDDQYEENDFDLQAYNISSYEGRWLSSMNGHGIQLDEDWYEIYVGPGFEYLIVNFRLINGVGYAQLDVYDADQNVMTKTYSQDEHGSFRFNLPSSGIYYIKVYGHNIGLNYDLQYITVFILEEQTWVNNVQESFDFYLIEVSPGFLQIEVELLFNNTVGNISMILFNEEGINITNSYSRDGNEYIDYFLQNHGVYFLLIYGGDLTSGLTSVEYDLWWDDVKTDLRLDDAYEHGYNNNTTNNNDLSSAYDLSNDERKSLWEINGLALQFDDDWYKIEVEETRLQLIVLVMYDSAEGLMGFDIYDSNYTKITGNFTLDDNDYIDYDVPSNGIYYIRIYGDNSGNVYNLWWATEEYEPIEMIPGYDTLILILSIVGVTAVVIKMKRSKFKHQ